jgi:hypothetical protein
MDRAADKKLNDAFEQLASYEVLCASKTGAQMMKVTPQAVKTTRKEERMNVIKVMGFDPKISEAKQVMQVFDNLAKAEVELHSHKGTETSRLLRETMKLRGVLETTANMLAAGVVEPVPKRAKREPAAAGGAAGDFVDLTQEDD